MVHSQVLEKHRRILENVSRLVYTSALRIEWDCQLYMLIDDVRDKDLEHKIKIKGIILTKLIMIRRIRLLMI